MLATIQLEASIQNYVCSNLVGRPTEVSCQSHSCGFSQERYTLAPKAITELFPQEDLTSRTARPKICKIKALQIAVC